MEGYHDEYSQARMATRNESLESIRTNPEGEYRVDNPRFVEQNQSTSRYGSENYENDDFALHKPSRFLPTRFVPDERNNATMLERQPIGSQNVRSNHLPSQVHQPIKPMAMVRGSLSITPSSMVNHDNRLKRQHPQSNNETQCKPTKMAKMETPKPVVAELKDQEQETKVSSPLELEDSLNCFFKSICISVRALPPPLISQAKLETLRMVTNLEYQATSGQATTVQHPNHSYDYHDYNQQQPVPNAAAYPPFPVHDAIYPQQQAQPNTPVVPQAQQAEPDPVPEGNQPTSDEQTKGEDKAFAETFPSPNKKELADFGDYCEL